MFKYVIIFMALCIPVQALAIDGEISFGTFLSGNTNRSAPGIESPPLYYTNLKIGQPINKYYVWTEFITLMDEQSGLSLHPSSIEYKIGVDLDVKWGFVVQFEHSCWHSIDTGSGVEQYNLIRAKYRF